MFLLFSTVSALAGFISSLPFLMGFQVFRSRGEAESRPIHDGGIYVFAFFMFGVFSVTGIPSWEHFSLDINLNLLPFADIGTNFIQYMQNIILFLPLGFLLPLLWDKYRCIKNTVICGMLVSLAIEIMQLFNYRATDVDDLLMNTAGTAMGYLAYSAAEKMIPKLTDKFCRELNNDVKPSFIMKWESEICFVLIWMTAFFLQNYISSFLWGVVL